MCNCDGSVTIGCALDERIASTSADGSKLRIASMEIDTGAGLSTTNALITTGDRDGVSVAADSFDAAIFRFVWQHAPCEE